jgi:NADPH-dependent ferric siderophore reductase
VRRMPRRISSFMIRISLQGPGIQNFQLRTKPQRHTRALRAQNDKTHGNTPHAVVAAEALPGASMAVISAASRSVSTCLRRTFLRPVTLLPVGVLLLLRTYLSLYAFVTLREW